MKTTWSKQPSTTQPSKLPTNSSKPIAKSLASLNQQIKFWQRRSIRAKSKALQDATMFIKT